MPAADREELLATAEKADRDRVLLPFQRLGDRDNETGVGLGQALSRGLAEAMGGNPATGQQARRGSP